MKTIYLIGGFNGSVQDRVVREWNSGQTLSQAVKRLSEWHNIGADQIIPIWKTLYKEWYPGSVKFKPRTREQIIEAAQSDPLGEHYLAWLGITGYGADLEQKVALMKA